MPARERARAKINLTLQVYGRRPDGYHQIESFAAFAEPSDRLTLTPGGALGLETAGPFAPRLDVDNLVLRAARAVIDTWPGAQAGVFMLEKNIPVAAGLGGGSADAAAALRLLAAANPDIVEKGRLAEIAARLGADIPVCLESRAALIVGRGETVLPSPPLPEVHAVLVNPGGELATADVYAALEAGPCPHHTAREARPPGPFTSARELAAWMAPRGNGLETAALSLAPAIAEVKAALEAAPGCLTARLSGSGPSCFGLFALQEEADAAAAAIASDNPGWWAAPSRLR